MGGQNFQYISKTQVKSQALLAGGVTLFFPLVFWIIELTLWKANISLQNIIFIHTKSPALWLIDALPLIVYVVTYSLLNQKRKVNNNLLQTVQQMKEQMDINARFAKAIGEGNYYSEFKVVSPDDILGNSLLIMRNNLLKNYQKEAEQSWIAEGKEQISNILRRHNKIEELAYEVIVKLIQYINAVQGTFNIYDDEKNKIINVATYAYNRKKYLKQEFSIGEGLIGECAFEMDIIYRTEIPDDYVTITSGILGDKKT